MSLDLSQFRTVFDDDFSTDKSLNTTLWAVSWGNADQFSFSGGALTLTGSAAESWNPVGIMQAANGKSAGEGYGLYQFTGYANAGQGNGICFIMWRADNLTVDSTMPYVATEIDILESWDGTKTGESTIHYYNSAATNGNGQDYNPYKLDLSVSHTYAMDWERGSLTFYVDGVKIYQDTTHAPLDYADGGSNEVMGAQILNETAHVITSTVQLHITEMKYSAPVTDFVAKAVSKTLTLGSSAQDIVAAAGTSVQAASGSDTITAIAGLVTVTGGSGQVLFFGGTGASSVNGGAGSLIAFGGTGGGTYQGGSGAANILVSQGASDANTTLRGGAWGDQIFGSSSGNDVLIAAVGRESILGGGGSTTVVGGATAASVIFTGSGPTTVFGGLDGGDTIVGGSGSVAVTAQLGDAVFGNAGALAVRGSTSGADSIIGGAGNLTVTGRGGNMLVVAGTGNSTIATGNGASLIFGSAGNTTLTGGKGSMEVVQGAGSLTVQEGAGATMYDIIKGAAGGSDVLTGFRPGTDKIVLYGYQQSDIQLVKGTSTVLSLSDGTTIQLAGVSDPGSSIIG